MKLTIIVTDKTVYKDGKFYSNLAWLGTPENVHALQWNNGEGWVEYLDGTPHLVVTELPEWADNAVASWNKADEVVPDIPPVPNPNMEDKSQQLKAAYAKYPIANKDSINSILTNTFKNIQLVPKVRDADANVIGIEIGKVAGIETGTGALGLLSIKDAAALCASYGVPIVTHAEFPDDKLVPYGNYVAAFGLEYIVSYGNLYYHTPWTLDMAKKHKSEVINSERDAALNAGFTYNGNVWDIDDVSRTNISAKVTGLLLANDPQEQVVWRTQDNKTVTMSQDEFKALATSVLEYVQAAYETSWTRKAAVDAAVTEEEVNAI
jgi:hypothetical protein